MDQNKNSVDIPPSELVSLRVYSHPPYQVEVILNCAFILLGMDTLQDFDQMKKVLKDDKFRLKLAQGINIEDVTPVQYYHVKEIIDEYRAKVFDKPIVIKIISNALSLIAEWVMLVYSKALTFMCQED